MRQYLDLLQDIKDNGEWEDPAREGMPRTKSIFSRELRFDLTKGFPAVTTKKLYWKGVVGELLCFFYERLFPIYPLFYKTLSAHCTDTRYIHCIQ